MGFVAVGASDMGRGCGPGHAACAPLPVAEAVSDGFGLVSWDEALERSAAMFTPWTRRQRPGDLGGGARAGGCKLGFGRRRHHRDWRGGVAVAKQAGIGDGVGGQEERPAGRGMCLWQPLQFWWS